MERIKNIEFLRIVFILVICCSHVHNKMMASYYDVIPIYTQLKTCFTHAWVPIHFFFIISGFFLFLKTDFSKSFPKFAKEKLIRLMPLVLFVVALRGICSCFLPMKFAIYENIFTILNIQNIGITKVYGDVTVSWFVSALFWGLSFWFYLYKSIDKKIFNIICACTIIFCYAFLVHQGGINYKNNNIIFNCGAMRALAGIGVGYFISMAYQNYKKKIINIWQKLLVTFAEIFLFSHLIYNICMHKIHYNNNLIFIINFVALFWLFCIKQGYFSKILDNNLSVFLGKFTFSIFLTHTFIFDVFTILVSKTHRAWVISHPILNITIPLVIAILFGVITYYVFEKPVTKWLKNKYCS